MMKSAGAHNFLIEDLIKVLLASKRHDLFHLLKMLSTNKSNVRFIRRRNKPTISKANTSRKSGNVLIRNMLLIIVLLLSTTNIVDAAPPPSLLTNQSEHEQSRHGDSLGESVRPTNTLSPPNRSLNKKEHLRRNQANALTPLRTTLSGLSHSYKSEHEKPGLDEQMRKISVSKPSVFFPRTDVMKSEGSLVQNKHPRKPLFPNAQHAPNGGDSDGQNASKHSRPSVFFHHTDTTKRDLVQNEHPHKPHYHTQLPLFPYAPHSRNGNGANRDGKNASTHSKIKSSVNPALINPNPRIINGTSVPRDSYPWFVSIGDGDPSELNYVCGGSLVASQFVLTAAHCVGSLDYVVVGSLCRNEDNCGQDYEVFSIEEVPHPSFQYSTIDYDYAILKLNGTSSFAPVAGIDNGFFSPAYSDGKDGLWGIGKL